MDNILIGNIVEKDNLHLARIIRLIFEEHNAPRTGTVCVFCSYGTHICPSKQEA